uniref:FAD-binding PCMH-type domain-containing protein n=1 Tax=Ditylum brightwellii TaxID=49249 RepID=A0A6V2D8W0_9STRA|mmetsp:Transcript_6926/g.9191  ORF Transcript_6926/g.9191 Transcript_6926/m.9191 type:complete len:492 (-) Transcript_6926:191-1666(-)
MGPTSHKVTPGQLDANRLGAAIQALEGVKGAAESLGAELDGRLVLASTKDNEYHAARDRCFWLNDAGYPAVIAKVASVEDVQKVVKAATSCLKELKLAVYCGGHTAMSMVDDALVVDMSGLNSVDVDTDAKRATVGGGCRIQDVDKALEGTGLGFVTGTNGDTGVSGLTLAGGFGYLGRQHGFACDNVLEAQVVLASGEVVIASDSGPHKELMQGLRGGGGNFGIVTRWVFRLHDVSNCFGGLVVRFAPTWSASVGSLKKWRDGVKDLPTPVMSAVALPGRAPVNVYLGVTFEEGGKDAKSATELKGLKFTQNLGGWFGLENSLKKRDHCTDAQKMLEPMNQPCYRLVSGIALANMSDDLIEKIITLVRKDCPTKHCVMLLFKMGGNANSPDSPPSVLSHRGADFWILTEGGWAKNSSQRTVQKVEEWMLLVKQTLMACDGYDLPYPMWDNIHSADTPDAHQAYGGAIKKFMLETKQKYDPSNIFSYNKNI